MSYLIDVIVPGPWWHPLTYESDRPLVPGCRVRVPLGRGRRVGFVLGPAEEQPDLTLRPVEAVLDEGGALDPDLWDLALWMGRAFLCGPGTALQTICPPQVLKGEPLPPSAFPIENASEKTFHETGCFTPWDGERRSVYIRKIEEAVKEGGRALILFPEVRAARRFLDSLPAGLWIGALLWPSVGGKKLWDAWQAVRSGQVNVVVAPPGGVFAPLRPTRVIVEDESSPAYVSQVPPRVPLRSLAGRRALALGAELTLGGRMPSARTYLRTRPYCDVLPDKKRIVFADMRCSFKGEEPGVEGELPLTHSLVVRTLEELRAGRHVLWVLDRRGEAAEVFCGECGRAMRCPRCGGVMRSEERGRRLRCILCGAREDLPSRCPDCQGELWTGRRPGLEALADMAGRLICDCPILLHDAKGRKKPPAPKRPTLILGTRGALSLCDALNVGLVGWLDLDAELRRPEYGARFQAFSMVWESIWRGRDAVGEGERVVVIQSRREGGEWRGLLAQGWKRFWEGELKLRSELDLPPCGLMVQFDLHPSEDREALIRELLEGGFFVMDPGEAALPLWVSAPSVEPVARLLAPRFRILRKNPPRATVWSE